MKRRWVRHFGFEFDYNTNGVNTTKSEKCPEFPTFVESVVERMLNSKIVPRKPEQLTVNHYLPGQGNKNKNKFFFVFSNE